jgi:hypothetical protein
MNQPPDYVSVSKLGVEHEDLLHAADSDMEKQYARKRLKRVQRKS